VTDLQFGMVMLAVLLALLVCRIPIGVAMLSCGAAGYAALAGWGPLLNYVKTAAFWRFSVYDLSVIPLFLLMGQLASKAELSHALFQTARVWVGHYRGGMAIAAIGGCAGFGAICGSSIATAATMGQVALPELRRYRYSGALATGALAAGGTLGILIPPSVILVIYAILTEGNIATLFQAGFIPAIIAIVGYVMTIALYLYFKPAAGPAGPKTTLAEKVTSLVAIWPIGVIFVVVIGGIYSGIFTPTEGAAFGAVGTGLIAFIRGRMNWREWLDCLYGTATATGMIFLILLGADIFNVFLALTQLPAEAARAIGTSGLHPYLILIAILLLYLILGCVMDAMSMILLTIPIFWPIVVGLDYGLTPAEINIWFGIVVLVVVEMGLITPPVGINVFIINALAEDTPMLESFRGIIPFLLSDIVRTALLIAFPALSLWLPRFLAG